MNPRRICVVTGTRAEYGLLRGLLMRLRDDPAVALSLVVTAAHLQPEFGLTVKEIEADAMPIAARVPLPLDGGTKLSTAEALGVGLSGMAKTLDQIRPDVVVVLGDRIELLAVASCCTVLGIPLAHIHGGEITEGAIDDAIRHAVTKMAHLHFPVAEAYRRRILQMGEAPERVTVVGAPGLENIATQDPMSRAELERDLGLALKDPVIVATCHPETASAAPLAPAEAMLKALDSLPDATVILTKAGADAGGTTVNTMIAAWAADRSNARVVNSLGVRRYLSLLRVAALMIGNSSSGIIEAPALGLPTVNIGTRQAGRLRAASIIDCPADPSAIMQAIRRALSADFRTTATKTSPPYGSAGGAERIHQALVSADLSSLLKKSFVDLPGVPA